MKKVTIISILLICLSVQAQTKIFGIQKSIRVDMYGKKNVYIGDSFTAGVGASDNSHRWTSMLSVAVGATEINYGVNGRVMQGLYCNDTLYRGIVPTFDNTYGVLIVSLGTNDTGQNNGVSLPDSFFVKYASCLEYWHNVKLWPYNQIVITTPFFFRKYTSWVGSCSVTTPANSIRHDQYVQKVYDLAAAYPVILADTYVAVGNLGNPYGLMISDSLHYNDTGHSILFRYFRSLL